MIRISCAWARSASLRRTSAAPSASCPATSSFGHTRLFEPASSPARVTRRWNASPPPLAQKAPELTKTIPGPSWLWLEPIYEPFRAYGRIQQRRPYMTQFVSALVIYFIGDIVAQSIGPAPAAVEEAGRAENRADVEAEDDETGWVQEWIEGRDWERTGRALLIGGLAAVPGYKWFLWLGNSFNYSSKVLSLTTKVTVNQLLFTPIFNSYFFGMQSLLSGATVPEIVERIKHTVPVSWVNSCKIWPAVTAFSFTFIPIQFRSIFGGVIAIGWQTYLSLLNQRAAAEEELEHMHEHEQSHGEIHLNHSSGRVVESDVDCDKCMA